jgi:hypothetical protein
MALGLPEFGIDGVRGIQQGPNAFMIPQSSAISLYPSYLGYAGLELAVWNRTGHVRPVFANRKDAVARRDEIVMG